MTQADDVSQSVIADICGFDWDSLNGDELSAIAWAYYYFSIQFRENLEIAGRLYAGDPQIAQLMSEECDTDNLSPWPGVADNGEKMNHDEFMRRVLALSSIDDQTRCTVMAAGETYLARARAMSDSIRACSIASYEDGGLESVFRAMLRAPSWDTAMLAAFRHFLRQHIAFDSNPQTGHGALARHLMSDESISCVWVDFRDLLVAAVPRLGSHAQASRVYEHVAGD